MPLRSATLRLASVVIVVAGAACGSTRAQPHPVAAGADVTEASQPHMAEKDIPPEAKKPSQIGDGSARSFKGLLDVVDRQLGDKRVPLPSDLAGLAAQSASIVHGRVTSIELRPTEQRLPPNLVAAGLDLHLSIEVQEEFKGPRSINTIDWVITIWSGDPVLAGMMLAKTKQELGPGPIGAEVILFGNAPADAPTSQTGALDGLIEAADGTFRIAPSTDAKTTHYLTTIPETLAQLREMLPHN